MTKKCITIGCRKRIKINARGRPTLRCDECKKAKLSREMAARYQEKKDIEADAAYLAGIPTYEDIFGHDFHASGTGVDQGSSED